MDQRRLGIAAHRAPVVHQDDRSAPGGHLYSTQRVAFGHDLTTGQRRAVELDAHAVTGCNRERAVLHGGRGFRYVLWTGHLAYAALHIMFEDTQALTTR